MANRAFAWNTGGSVPTGFSNQGNLIWETSQGSAGVSLAPDGPEGYIYWGGPTEGSGVGTYVLVTAQEGAPTHTGANGEDSNVQFWGAGNETDFSRICKNVTNQGFTDVDPQAVMTTFAQVSGFFNAIDGWQAFDFS
tara:strand:+ start:81 stop:491 length:411 start_codon:yes stop_codon:yes gene_type:complete